MKTVLTKGLDKDASNEIKLSFNASGLLRERYKVLLEEKIKTADKKSYSEEGYDCPNWAYKQAHLAGYKSALKEIISLF